MYNYRIELENARAMSDDLFFRTKAEAVKAFNYLKNRSCCGSSETTLYQGAYRPENVGYEWRGKEFILHSLLRIEQEDGSYKSWEF